MIKVYEKEFYQIMKQLSEKTKNTIIHEEKRQKNMIIQNLLISGFDFSGRNFKNIIFLNVTFKNINMINCFFENGAKFVKCKFVNVDFRFSVFGTETLVEPEFFECDFYSSEFEEHSLVFDSMIDFELAKERNYFFFNQCPDEGDIIGWKKVSVDKYKKYLVMLLIQNGEYRKSETTERCKCVNSRILGVEKLDGERMESKSNFTHLKILEQLNKEMKKNNGEISFYIDKEVARNNDF